MHMRGRGDWRFLLRQKAKGRRQKTKVRNELTLPNCSLDLEHRDLPKKTLASIAFLTFAFCLLPFAFVGAASFDVVEATIASTHAAMKAHTLTCHALVDAYLQRIAAYDKNGPAINAIVVTNPEALTIADDLDRRFARSGFVGPLHCVPTIVKDNFETVGLQSADGSASLAGSSRIKTRFS